MQISQPITQPARKRNNPPSNALQLLSNRDHNKNILPMNFLSYLQKKGFKKEEEGTVELPNTTNMNPKTNSVTISNTEKKEIEVSVVIPCLNEEPTIGECINKIKNVFKKLELPGEIIVSDSSNDNSPKIAKNLGAKVVHPPEKGYGNAYITGISEAKGQYIVMADADGTYNLEEIYRFIKILQNNGADIAIGTRLKGRILHGAMPRLHRYIGNPLLTLIANILFGTRISDMHCGMRAITKKAWKKVKAISTGMEFASEMLIKAAKKGLKIVETPITYLPRKGAKSKLNPFKDGCRHLKLLIKLRFTKLFSK